MGKSRPKLSWPKPGTEPSAGAKEKQLALEFLKDASWSI